MKVARGWRVATQVREHGAQVVDPASAHRVARDDRPRCQTCGREVIVELDPRQLDRRAVDEIGLGQRNAAVFDGEQLEDLHVLGGLRHPAFTGVDHEHGDVDRSDPREHVLGEADVSGNVDEPDQFLSWRVATFDSGEREAEVDCEPRATSPRGSGRDRCR